MEVIQVNNDLKTCPIPMGNGLRIKKIANIAFLTLAVLSVALLSTAVLCNHFSVIPPALALQIIKISSISLSVLIGLKCWEQLSPYLPQPVRTVANLVQIFVLDNLSSIALGLLLPFNFEKLNPKTAEECDPNQTPIILVNGFLGTSSNFIYLRHRLKQAGYTNVFTVNLGSPFNSINDYTQKVNAKINEIKTLTRCSDIHIIGHSMGGLVARNYRYNFAKKQDVTVKKIITLGTPLNGTIVAYFVAWISQAANEMRWRSEFVKDLQRHAKQDRTTQHYHLGTRVDHIVFPTSSAYEGCGLRSKTYTLDATGHVSFVFSDEAADLILESLATDLPF